MLSNLPALTQLTSTVPVTADRTDVKPAFPKASYTHCNVKPHELFERFFDQSIIDMIVAATNDGAIKTTNVNPEITSNEMRVFLGILIFSGTMSCGGGSQEMYWKDSLLGMRRPMIADAIAFDRFERILELIRFSTDSHCDTPDLLWKLRPLLTKLDENFRKNFEPVQDLSFAEGAIYDSSVVPGELIGEKDNSLVDGEMEIYEEITGDERMRDTFELYGRYRVKYEYPVWCLNSLSGYLVSFDICQTEGQTPHMNPAYETNYGKNAATLFQMIDNLKPEHRRLPYCFYFEKKVTTIPMLTELLRRGYHASGAIQETLIPSSCSLPTNADMKNQPCGYSIAKSLAEPKITFTKWTGPRVFSIASTLFEKNTIEKTALYYIRNKKTVEVDVPSVAEDHNNCVIGADRMNENMAECRIKVWTSAWWWPIFIWCIDVAAQNAWVLQRKAGVKIRKHDFRLEIVEYYCRTYGANKVGEWEEGGNSSY